MRSPDNTRAPAVPNLFVSLLLRVTGNHQQVENEYKSEYEDLVAGDRDAMDPYVYDLYQAVRYVEEFGGEKIMFVIAVSDSEVTGISSQTSKNNLNRLIPLVTGSLVGTGISFSHLVSKYHANK